MICSLICTCLQAFSAGGVQASNSSLPKTGEKKSLALIFVQGRAGEGTKRWGKQKRKRVDERVWKGSRHAERSDGRGSSQGHRREEKDKGLKVCGEAESQAGVPWNLLFQGAQCHPHRCHLPAGSHPGSVCRVSMQKSSLCSHMSLAMRTASLPQSLLLLAPSQCQQDRNPVVTGIAAGDSDGAIIKLSRL